MSECKKCGVAFDVGRRYCVEPECSVTKKCYPPKPVNPIYTRLVSTRLRAKRKSIDHDLTIEWIAKTIHEPCVYCGEVGISQLDRADNSKGYTMDNVVPACKRCNTVKSMYLSHEQMIIVAKALGWTKNLEIIYHD